MNRFHFKQLMKRGLAWALSFFLLALSVACQKDLKARSSSQPSALAKTLVEINGNLVGMWDVTGPHLRFRLLDDGTAEYDRLNRSKMMGKQVTTKDIAVRETVQIGTERLQAYRELLNSQSFSALKSEYRERPSCVDNFDNFEVRITRPDGSILQTSLLGCGDPASQDRPYAEGFPPELTKLFVMADEDKKNRVD